MIGDYPIGAEFDPSAPYNQDCYKSKNVLVSLSISKPIKIKAVSEDDKENILNQTNLIETFNNEGWNIDEFIVVDDF